MRALPASAVVLLAAALPAQAQPYRDDLPIPAYRLLASMLAQFSDGTATDRATNSLEVAVPLVRALDQKYAAGVERLLRDALQAGDRDGALDATTALVLLDSQDLLAGLQRDENTGWADAKIRARKAVLDYRLVAERMKRLQPALDGKLVADLGQLVTHLHEADLATAPEDVLAHRDDVVADLAGLRQALGKARVRPPARGRP